MTDPVSNATEIRPTASAEDRICTNHPNGHFYSPVVDPTTLDSTRIWPGNPQVIGVDFDDAGHEQILSAVFPRWMPHYDYAERLDETTKPAEFFTCNPAFSWLDARALFVLLCEWQPQRLIEVGSGFSTLLTADVNRRFFDGSMNVTCIEPYPMDFLRNEVAGVNRILEAKVQDVSLNEFTALESGDVLFIDSSHVAKTGSDVNYLYFEVLPRLAPGVRVHIHDIFLPHDYPREWVLDENRSWNEQYLLRALLMHSKGFRVIFGCSYAFWRFPELVRTALAHPNGHAFAGGSFWIERI